MIDAEDGGTVSLTAREPQVGRTVVATVSDPDGGVTLTRWTWATSESTVNAGRRRKRVSVERTPILR